MLLFFFVFLFYYSRIQKVHLSLFSFLFFFFPVKKVLRFLEQNRHSDRGDVLSLFETTVYLAGSEMGGPRSSLMVQGSEVVA